MSISRSASVAAQRGLVLVTSLLLLVVVTILAIAMFRSFGLDERIAGNVREKQRALNAAETAEQFAETWLSQGNGSSAIACAAPVTYPVVQVCTTTLQAQGINPAILPWPQYVNYVPQTPTPMVSTGVGNAIGGQGTYYTNPGFYIGFLNTAMVNGVSTTIYQIDAVGYGGSGNAAAVVETTYQVQASTKNLGEGQ
jgi:type IV pilus assembly protein PilX